MGGLTAEGFEIETLADILDDITTDQLNGISPSLNLQPTAIMGVNNGIFAKKLAEAWQVLGAIVAAEDPDAATGDQADAAAAMTGTLRRDAEATVIEGVIVNVAAGFHAEPGEMVASIESSPADQFYTLTAVDNPSLSAADITVDFICTDPGPVQALAGTLTVKAEDLNGWNSVNNPNDGTPGKDIENDAELRISRLDELAAPGSATPDAIRADVLEKVPATRSCRVLFNDKDKTDANGVPPHSIEVIARLPGATSDDDQALAQVIFEAKVAGDGTHGTTSKTVVDSQGNTDIVSFTRPAELLGYIALTVLYDPKVFPLDGADQVASAIAAYGDDNLGVGQEAYWRHLLAQAFTVPGVLDVPAFAIDTAPSPTTAANITVDVRTILVLSTSRIAVTAVTS